VVTALLLVAAPAALASATTYCVNEPACPAGGVNVGKGDGAALQEALVKAGETPGNTVLIGEGTYEHEKGFAYKGGAVTIRGANEERTILTDDGAANDTVLSVTTPSTTAIAAVSQLSVGLPRAFMGKGVEQAGVLAVAGAQLEHVSILGGGGPDDVGADIEGGAAFEHGVIELRAEGEHNAGAFVFGGRLTDSAVIAEDGVVAVGPEQAAVRGCIVASVRLGLEARNATLFAEDTFVDADSMNAVGVSVEASLEKAAAATLRGLTIVGGRRGVVVEANATKGTTTAASAVLESTVVAETLQGAYSVFAAAPAGDKATARLRYLYSDLVGKHEIGSEEVGEPKVEQEHSIESPPQFVNPVPGEEGFLAGDWRPAPGSPLIDAGVPGPLEEGEFTTDLEGNPRIVHGRRDIGAYEYGFKPPTVTATATPTTAVTGQSVAFSGLATVTESGDTITSYQWTFDDGATVPAGATATHAFTTAGLHTATLTATDAAGVQASTTVQVLVTKAPPGPEPPVNCKCGPLVPLSGLSLAPLRFRALRRGATVLSTGASGGTVVKFTLGSAGLVVFTPEQLQKGVRRGRRCVAARHRAHGRICSHLVAMGSFSQQEPAGAQSLRFSGRVHGKRLPPGHYELLVSVGRTTLATVFTIVR
jgi:hypothetical protein